VPLAPAVNLAKSFPIISYRKDGVDWDQDDLVKAKITSSTNLQFDAKCTCPAGPVQVIEWQVVEYQDANVQTGDVTFLAGDGSKTAPLAPAIKTARSWLIYSFDCDLAGPGCPGSIPTSAWKTDVGCIGRSENDEGLG